MPQSDTLTRPDADLDAMFEQDIPCGICGKPAEVRSRGHEPCGPGKPLFVYKCVQCHARWYQDLYYSIARNGAIACDRCDRLFNDITKFSDYRRF